MKRIIKPVDTRGIGQLTALQRGLDGPNRDFQDAVRARDTPRIMALLKEDEKWAIRIMKSNGLRIIQVRYDTGGASFTCDLEDLALAQLTFERLQKQNWPPWWPIDANMFIVMNGLCAEGQITILSKGFPIANLNMNRIDWKEWKDDIESLKWDRLIGSVGNFQKGYRSDGDTLVMLNLNVDRNVQGRNLPRDLIGLAKAYADPRGIERIVGTFRPKDYGTYKLEQFDREGRYADFRTYSELKRDDGLPYDSWLRNLARNGMHQIGISHDTTVIQKPVENFESYKATYNKGKWREVAQDVWECGENGTWHINQVTGVATYKESRVIGLIWER